MCPRHVCLKYVCTLVDDPCMCVFWYSQKLHRKKAGLLMSCAKLSENMEKNRYKDVLPCKFLLMSKKLAHLFLLDRQIYEYWTDSQFWKSHYQNNYGLWFIFSTRVSSQCLSYYCIFRSFLFSMSKRVFESEPECLHCFVIMIELCYDYRCKALRCEWITVIVKCIILFYCVKGFCFGSDKMLFRN